MLDYTLIKRKLALSEEELQKLTPYRNMTLEQAAGDFLTQAAVERVLEKVITRGIDINRHIIGAIGTHLRAPRKNRETFLHLAELALYPREFAEKIAPSAGFRNALVHDYNNLDEATRNTKIGDAIKMYTDYAKYILDFLDQHRAADLLKAAQDRTG